MAHKMKIDFNPFGMSSVTLDRSHTWTAGAPSTKNDPNQHQFTEMLSEVLYELSGYATSPTELDVVQRAKLLLSEVLETTE